MSLEDGMQVSFMVYMSQTSGTYNTYGTNAFIVALDTHMRVLDLKFIKHSGIPSARGFSCHLSSNTFTCGMVR